MNFTLNYVIREDRKNGKGTCPIYLRYTFNRRWCNLPLKLSIEPIFWDKKNFNLNTRKRHTNFNDFRKKMGVFEKNIRELVEKHFYLHQTYPSTEEIIKIFKGKSEGGGDKENVRLRELYLKFTQFKKSHFVENSTLTIYKTTWEKWELFEKNNSVEFGLSDMNEKNLSDFIIFLLNQELQKNTIGKYIKTLKSFLNYVSLNLEMNVPPSFKRVKVFREEKYDFQVLTKEEFEVLKKNVFFSRYNLETDFKMVLSEREVLIGRVMVFLCSTGLSFVDFDRLTIDDVFIDEDKLDTKRPFVNIKINRQKLKTTEVCVIPILDITIDLLVEMLGLTHKFYEGQKKDTSLELKMMVLKKLIGLMKKGKKFTPYQPRLFPKILVNDFNKEIKEVMKKIGINSNIKIRKNIKGKVVEEVVPKYKKISSHTGRRTYITSCLLLGIRPHILMKSTGHKKVGTLLRYNKETDLNINNEFQSKVNTKGSED
jgi:integrase